MKAAGWKPSEKGCIGDSDDSKNHGAICLYSRKDGIKEEGLAIILAQDEKAKQTNIFYARIDMTQPTASPIQRRLRSCDEPAAWRDSSHAGISQIVGKLPVFGGGTAGRGRAQARGHPRSVSLQRALDRTAAHNADRSSLFP